MFIDTGTLIALNIALIGACLVIVMNIKENHRLQKKVVELQVALRTERRKDETSR